MTDEGEDLRAGEQEVVDARGRVVRAVHDHARQHGRERRAAVDPELARTSQISELEWVVAGYALTFAAFMLTGGKLADLFGRRLIFMVGLVVFTALVARVRPRAERDRPDRRARRAGRSARR